MQISPITNYNQQININKQRQINNLPSFEGINVKDINLKQYFASPEYAENFIKKIKKLQKEKFNLREIVDVSKLSDTGKVVLKRYFDQLGEEGVQDFPMNLKLKQSGVLYHDYYGLLTEDVFRSNYVISNAGAFSTFDKCMRIKTGYSGSTIYLLTNVNLLKSEINRYILDTCNEQAKMIDEKAAKERKNKKFDELQGLLEAEPKKNDALKKLEVPADDLLPVDSVVCTLDDINNYFIEHMTEVSGGRIFNKPVTKDGESLLMALAHVKPDKDNIDSYIKLVKSMLKMPYIEYNQKDSMDVPFIAHVLNSQNKVLFAAVTGCKDLKYDPSLEFEFNNITDPEFKELVLKTSIFENEQNKEFKTIFGKPNPMYGGKGGN